MRLHHAFLAALLGASAVPSMAGATTTLPITAEDLARRSDLVVVATVRNLSAQWIDGLIVTDVELTVDVVVRGAATVGATVLVRAPGGVVGRIGQVVPEAPVFETGRTFLLFLAGGTGPYHYLAHLTAAAVPLASSGGAMIAAPAPSLLVDHGAPAGTRGVPAAPLLDRLRAAPR